MLEIGKKAPDFTLLNQDNESMSLSDFKGKKLFYTFILEIIHLDVLNKHVVLESYIQALLNMG